jgi:hypothetical protein
VRDLFVKEKSRKEKRKGEGHSEEEGEGEIAAQDEMMMASSKDDEQPDR